MKKLEINGRVSLFNSFKEQGKITKEYIITSFLAVLEISNKQGIKICQDNTFSDILIICF
jgi:chromatin segregation and condensation protein Rec8/ScpA/Scc1 (kleisin family)